MILLFKDPEVNKHGAQLIFSSQDVSTMRNDVFRRDEIWFAARGEGEASPSCGHLPTSTRPTATWSARTRPSTSSTCRVVMAPTRTSPASRSGASMAARRAKGWRSGRREGRSRMVQMTRHLVVSEGKETEPRYFEGVRAALGAANGARSPSSSREPASIRSTCSTSPSSTAAARLRRSTTCGWCSTG